MANKNKCMKGYTMNSNGSCVTIKRKNVKRAIKKSGNIGGFNPLNNREALPCCGIGCYDTLYKATCQYEWDSSVGLYRNVLHLHIHGQIGGAMGCEFGAIGYDNSALTTEEAIRQELSYLNFTEGGWCQGDLDLPQGPRMHDCNHTLDYCIYEGGSRPTYCSGYWILNEAYQEFGCNSDNQPGGCAPYVCGNFTPILPDIAPPKTWGRRGGSVKQINKIKRRR